MATLTNTDLRPGTVYKDGDEVYTVLSYNHQFRGRGGGIVRVKVRNLHTGSVVEKTYRGNEKVESVDTRKNSVVYLYSDSANATFMNGETYEQFTLSTDSLGDSLQFLSEGQKVIALYLEDAPIAIEIPKTVVLEITHTIPGVKGDTANNPTKKATLENGLEIEVPLFSKVGDKVKVNTDTGAYVSRA